MVARVHHTKVAQNLITGNIYAYDMLKHELSQILSLRIIMTEADIFVTAPVNENLSAVKHVATDFRYYTDCRSSE